MKDVPELEPDRIAATEGQRAPLVDMAVPPGARSELDRLRLVSEQQITPKISEGWWQNDHHDLVQKAATTDSQMQFYGDSITNFIGNGNMDAFERNFGALKPDNFGIPGDISSELLWRVNHGELAGHPKLRVLMIGTNDLTADPPRTAEQIAGSIGDIVKTMRAQDPQGKILIMGLLPRGSAADQGHAGLETKREMVNQIIEGLDNGKTVRYLDVGSRFVAANGAVREDLLPDHLHPSHAGYDVWSDAIKPLVERMTGSK